MTPPAVIVACTVISLLREVVVLVPGDELTGVVFVPLVDEIAAVTFVGFGALVLTQPVIPWLARAIANIAKR
jgi:hypothetical protein